MILPGAKRSLQACIFDMDGVLIDSEGLIRDLFIAAGAQLGYSISNEVYLMCVGRNRQDSEEIIKEHVSHDFPHDQARAIVDAKLSSLLSSTGWPLKAGVAESLNQIVTWGLRRCVATSTARHLAEQRLESAKIRHYFESITCGDEVTRGKPAPDIFILAAKRLELLPEQCIVLEDSEYGARAALEAGMRCVMVPDLKTPPESLRQQLDGIFDDLAGAVRYIQGISPYSSISDTNSAPNSATRSVGCCSDK
jgi:beta-phosphoglucomutase-like phosphatase (HAD superfamily)